MLPQAKLSPRCPGRLEPSRCTEALTFEQSKGLVAVPAASTQQTRPQLFSLSGRSFLVSRTFVENTGRGKGSSRENLLRPHPHTKAATTLPPNFATSPRISAEIPRQHNQSPGARVCGLENLWCLGVGRGASPPLPTNSNCPGSLPPQHTAAAMAVPGPL